MVICTFIEDLESGRMPVTQPPADPGNTPNRHAMSSTISLTKWSSPRELSDRTTHGKPALATSGSTICMAWRSFGQDNIWVSTSVDNGKTWSDALELPSCITRHTPALTVFNGRFVMAWRSPGYGNICVAHSADGLTWSPKAELADRSTPDAPSLAAVKGIGIVMAWRSTKNTIWVSVSEDGLNWSLQKELDDRTTQSSPAITGTTHNGGLFAMMWRSGEHDHLWTSNSRDGLNWSRQKEISSCSTNAAAGLSHAGLLGVFYAAWHGLDMPGNPNICVSYSTDGINYMPAAPTGMKSTGGPAVTPAGGSLLMAFRGAKKNNIFVSNLQLQL